MNGSNLHANNIHVHTFYVVVCKYRVTTITSNEAGADTDDNMYITLSLGGAGKGEEKTAELIKLDNKGRDDFKRHQTDIFHITATCFNDPAVITMWSKGTEEPPQRVCLEGDAWKVYVVTVELIKNGKPAWTMSCFFDEWLKCSHKRCEHMWLE
ncbi:hypothetical protein LSAT2_019866 [Lamellibrachia satsuma]|nr:hypothetical protein LSAT2_019866 [Lamellibrachia satsuma]